MPVSEHALIVLTVDLDAVVSNWRFVTQKLKGAVSAAVVKADAYGLGADRVVPVLVNAGCKTFFVATVDEGLAVRKVAPNAEILVLSGPLPGSEAEFDHHNLTPVLNSLEQVSDWRAYGRQTNKILDAAFHLDTGMTRLGLDSSDLLHPELFAGLRPVLGMSHLACSNEPSNPMNSTQRERFAHLVSAVPFPRLSLAASGGIFLGEEYHFDLVRPGAALYGLNPTLGAPNPLHPTVRLQARVLQIRDVDLAQTVGYGATHRISAKGRIATVAAGYADGCFRTLGGHGQGVIGGVKVPAVGRISMDLITFDISALPEDAVHSGDLIDLIGPGHDADALAAEAGTVGYEILTQLPRRAARRYIGGSL